MPPRTSTFTHLPSTCLRTFSTTSALARRPRTNVLDLLPDGAPSPPPYPYPRRHNLYNQSKHGLYGNKMIQFGNKISEQNEHKSRRTWSPNVQSKRIYSRALDLWIRMRVTTSVLRTIDHLGGVDNYLLGRSPARLKEIGPLGWNLRWLILQTPWAKETLKDQWQLMVEGTGEGARALNDMPAHRAAAAEVQDGDGILGVEVETADEPHEDSNVFMEEAPAPPRSATTL